MANQIKFKPSAFKELEQLPKRAQRQVVKRIELLKKNHKPPWVEPLKEERGFYRARSGDYRIVFAVLKGTIWILKVCDRKDVYRALTSLRKFVKKSTKSSAF